MLNTLELHKEVWKVWPAGMPCMDLPGLAGKQEQLSSEASVHLSAWYGSFREVQRLTFSASSVVFMRAGSRSGSIRCSSTSRLYCLAAELRVVNLQT